MVYKDSKYKVKAVVGKNGDNGKIILSKGNTNKEIPAVIFNAEQKKKILELVD